MSGNDIIDIENSFDISFLRKNFEGISIDIAESIIDQAIENEIIKEIPIVKTIHSVGKTILGIKQLAFKRKVLKFLVYTSDLSTEEKQRFISSMDEATEKRTSEVLLHFLDQFDNDKKIKVLSNLIKAKIKENISIDIFIRLSRIVEMSYYSDLVKLEDYYGGRGTDGYNGCVTHSLISVGLVYFPHSNIRFKTQSISLGYDLTDNGRNLLKYGFNIDLI